MRGVAGVQHHPALADRGVTRREAEVLMALRDRLTNAEIAGRLYVSERTVESHVTSLLRKLGARSRVQLGDVARDLHPTHPAGRAPLPAALALLAESGPFVGRTAELARLRALWGAAKSGRLLVGVVAGEAGVGKSRLVAELAAAVHGEGAQVLWGGCFEDLQTPFHPFVQAISADVPTIADAELRRRLAGAGRRIAWLLPELAAAGAVPLTDEVLDPASAQAEVFASLHTYFARAAEVGPLLVVVDDLHWATSTTLAAIRYLARVSGHGPVLFVATTRDQPPDVHAELAEVLAELATLPAVERLDLAGLDEQAVAALVATIDGEALADPAAVSAATGGNPLYVRELAAASNGKADSLQGLLARRYALLGAHDLDVLDVAAVVGSEFDADLLARAVGLPLDVVLDCLERGEAAGVIVRVPDRRGTFSFGHDLFRTARYDTIADARRSQLHARIVGALREQADDPHALSELARHASLAAVPGGADIAIGVGISGPELAERSRRALQDAGDRAWALNDFAAAIRAYEDALRIWPAADPARATVLLGLARAVFVAEGRGADLLHEARDALAATGDDAGVAETEAMLGELEWAACRWETASEHFARAAELVRSCPPTRGTALVLSKVARLRMLTGSNQVARELGTQAIDMARGLGLEAIESDALITVGTAQVSAGGLAGVADIEAGVDVAERLDSPTVARGYANLRLAYDLTGDLPRARQLHRRASAAAERFGLAEMTRWTRAHETEHLFALGRWDHALAAAESFVAEFEESAYYLVTVCLRVRARVRMARGNPIGALADAAAAAEFARGARHPSNLLAALPFLTRCLWETGRAAEADTALDDALAAAPGHEVYLEPIDTAIVMSATGRQEQLVEVLKHNRLPSARREAGLLIADGHLAQAADHLAQMEYRSAEAYVRLLAAERFVEEGRPREAQDQVRRALAFHRAVRATAYVARAERLVAALS